MAIDVKGKNKGKKIADIIFQPLGKTIIFGISVIVSGILCSALVTEITVDGIPDYSIIIKATTTKLIGIYLVLILIYQVLAYKKEVSLEKRIRAEYDQRFENILIEEIIKKECLTKVASKYKEFIDNAKTPLELKEIIEDMKGSK